MAFERTDTIKDSFSDEILDLLQESSKFPTMAVERRAVIEQAIALMEKKGYISFAGQTQNHFLSRVGTSYLYDVPKGKTGHLKPFRGKRVRVVCVGSGKHSERQYMAGEISHGEPLRRGHVGPNSLSILLIEADCFKWSR